MLVLRLVRTGRRNQPKFRLVAAEQGKKVKGAVVEILGHYEPAASDKPFVFNKENTQHWVDKGAVVSNTVAKLLNKEGFNLPVHQHAEAKPKKKAQAKLDAANKPAEAAPVAEEATEAPAEGGEVPTETPAAEEASAETPAVAAEEAPSEEAPAAAAEPTNEES